MIARLGYDPEGDLDNSPDSIFCGHGAGFTVKWDQVPAHAHSESQLEEEPPEAGRLVVHASARVETYVSVSSLLLRR